MPGYVIHLAVAEEYLKKHKDRNEEYNEFIDGVIFPDSVQDKSLTHYGVKSSKANLVEYLKDKKLDTSFNRGYFLHLLTDYLFYNRYIETFTKDMYNDYDILNKYLINKYEIRIPEKLKHLDYFTKDIKGELKILSEELINRFISEVSELDINEVEKDIKCYPETWNIYRTLKKSL